MNKSSIARALLLLLALVAPAAATVGAPVLDQFNTPSTPDMSEAMNGTVKFVAQTFRAGATGYLSQADVRISRANTYNNPFTLTIRTTDGAGKPTATVLATQNFPASLVNIATDPPGLDPDWVSVTFDNPAAIATNDLLALTLETSGVPVGQLAGFWDGNFGETYSPGGPFWSSNGTTYTTFFSYPLAVDFSFRTYTSVPEPFAACPLLILLATLRRSPRIISGRAGPSPGRFVRSD
jgi:hypothetical protein